MKLLSLNLAVVCLLVSIYSSKVIAAESIQCNIPSVLNCDYQIFNLVNIEYRRLEQIMEARYENQTQAINETEFQRDAAIFLTVLNAKRSCQRQLEMSPQSCRSGSMSFNRVYQEVGGVTGSQRIRRGRENSEGNCEFEPAFDNEPITFTSSSGEQLFNFSPRNHTYLLSYEYTCSVQSEYINQVRRNFSFGGRNEENGEGSGYFFFSDYTDMDTDPNDLMKDSNSPSMRVDLRNDAVTRTFQQDSVTFTWSRGAYVKISNQTGAVIESNFIAPGSYQSDQCVSETYQRSVPATDPRDDRPRALRGFRYRPVVELQSEYEGLRVREVRY